MKRNLIPILLAIIVFLGSCGVNSPKPVDTTESPPETTTPVPSIETTEPTEETVPQIPNFFDENEITMWEFCDPYINDKSISHEEEAAGLSPACYILGDYLSTELYRHNIYGYTKDHSLFVSDQVDTELTVFVKEYPSENLPIYVSNQEIGGILGQYVDQLFDAYQKHIDPEIQMDAWVNQHKGYKLVACQVAHVLKCENFTAIAMNNQATSHAVFPENSFVADSCSGNILQPDPHTSGTILSSFTVNCNGESVECLVAYRRFLQNFDAVRAYAGETYIYRDQRYTVFEQFSILVPEEYDGLLIGYCDIEEPLLEEEAFYERISGEEETGDSEEPADWWKVSMNEYLKGLENYKLHYWGIIPQASLEE